MEIHNVASLSTLQSSTESWAYTQFKKITHSFKWTIDDLSSSSVGTGEYISSPTFPADANNDEHKWILTLYPKGESEKSKDYLSIFLELVSRNTKELRTQFKLSVQNASNDKKHILQRTDTKIFSQSTSNWGWNNFILRDEMLKSAGKLLPLDKLTVCCEVRISADTVNVSGRNIQVTECPLTSELSKIFENQKLSDVSLVSADGRELRAHKVILAARSPVFSDMFECEMKESILGRVTITDMDHDVLQEMVQYIYTGKVPNMDKRPKDLLVAADKYALDHLKVMCEDHLFKTLSVSNAAEILMLADVRSAKLLKLEAINFINMHAIEVMETDGWRQMNETRPQLAVKVFRGLARQQKPLKSPPQKRQKQ